MLQPTVFAGSGLADLLAVVANPEAAKRQLAELQALVVSVEAARTAAAAQQVETEKKLQELVKAEREARQTLDEGVRMRDTLSRLTAERDQLRKDVDGKVADYEKWKMGEVRARVADAELVASELERRNEAALYSLTQLKGAVVEEQKTLDAALKKKAELKASL